MVRSRLFQAVLVLASLLLPLAGWYGGSHFLPGTFLGTVDISNQTYAQARRLVLAQAKKQPQQWCFQADSLRFCFPAAAIGFAFQPEKSLQQAWQNRFHRRGWRQVFPWQYRLDWQKWQAQLATAASQLKKPAIPPSLALTNGQVMVRGGQQGQDIDWQKLRQEIMAASQKGQIPPVWDIPLYHWGDYYSPDQLRQAQERAQKLQGKTLVFQGEKENFVLTGQQLVNFVGFQTPWQEDKIKTYLRDLAETLDEPPQNSLFQFEKGRVVAFRPAKVGRRLKTAQLAAAMKDCLQKLSQKQQTCLVHLEFSRQRPAITTAASNRLGIRELVASGDSYFWGSSANRIHNLTLASQKLNGLLIAPGETFSFNKAVGEISAATGYRQAYIIKEGKTILGDGGGVCQVSTTLFRAALNAGLPILERHAHAYRVHYYEENAPLGLDATVFAPNMDLRFQNDYANYLLLQTKIDVPHRHLVFQFYGTRDGRRVEISPPRTWDWQPAPPPRYIDDPSLPPGVTKQIDWAAAGIKVAVDWRVWRAGKLLHQQTFFSNYQPWQAVYRRGRQ